MNESIIKKTILASAVSMAIMCPYVIAAPDQLPITNLLFKASGQIFDAGGLLNSAGTVGPFDPNTDLVNDSSIPPIRSLAPGFDPLTAGSNIYSFDPFFGDPWEAIQQTPYLTNTDGWAFVFDDINSDCSAPVGVTKSSGPCSGQGSYDYDASIAGMSDEQTAVGVFFNWSGKNEIAVLEIFDCDANDNCTGNGVPIANGPFSGQVALFNTGLSCLEGFRSTGANTPLSINIAEDVLGTDTPPSNCTNPTAADPIDNPAGLKVDSVVSPTANGGTAIINGTDIDYTPVGGFEGADSFIVNVSDDTGGSTSLTYKVQVGGQLQNNFSMLDRSGNIFGGTNDVDIVWDETSFNTNTLDANGIPTDTNFGLMTIASPEPFFNFTWNAHHVRVFNNNTTAPITYNFDVTCEASDYDAGVVDCDKPLADQGALQRFMTMTLEPGEVGGHILFDWGKNDATTACGKKNCDIDIVNKWQENAQWNNYGHATPINALWMGPAGVPPATDALWRLVSSDVNGDLINASPMIDGAFEGSYANFNYKLDSTTDDTDSDMDGIPDGFDNCPINSNPAQINTDGDAEGDVCDVDDDNDGVLDQDDAFPLDSTRNIAESSSGGGAVSLLGLGLFSLLGFARRKA